MLSISKKEYVLMDLLSTTAHRREMRDYMSRKYKWVNPEQMINFYLNNLILKRIVEKEDRGKYKLTNAGSQFLHAMKLRDGK